MIVSMGHHVFRGRHERRGTNEPYGYQVFIDPGRFETAWRATVYRGAEPCGKTGGVLAGTLPRLDAIRSIAAMVEEAIDGGDTDSPGHGMGRLPEASASAEVQVSCVRSALDRASGSKRMDSGLKPQSVQDEGSPV